MKLYLDDTRSTPDGWERTYTVEETISKLETRTVTHLSVDNDLGSLDYKTEGFNVLNWLERTIYEDPTFPIPEITIHSSNSGRKPTMILTVRSIEKVRQQRENGS